MNIKDRKRKRFRRKNADSSSSEEGGGGGGDKAADEERILKDCTENQGPIFVGPKLHNVTFALKKVIWRFHLMSWDL